jgi:hypothetical protein
MNLDKTIFPDFVLPKGFTLANSTSSPRGNKGVVLQAVKEFGKDLRYASKELQDDREVVLEAVKQYGKALKFASPRLKADREIVTTAILRYASTMAFASDSLKHNREFVLEVVGINGLVLEHVADQFKNDKEVVLVAIQEDIAAFMYASEELQTLCGQNDPIQALEASMRHDRLNQTIVKNTNQVQERRGKI